MFIEVNSENNMKAIGQSIGQVLLGGEIIELIGDIGAGKTTLVKGIAVGLGIDEYVQSPSFTINRVYQARDGLTLIHYDFYRLEDAGIMADELQEVIDDPKSITVIEWADAVMGVLPSDRLSIRITSTSETERKLDLTSGGETSQKLIGKIKS